MNCKQRWVLAITLFIIALLTLFPVKRNDVAQISGRNFVYGQYVRLGEAKFKAYVNMQELITHILPVVFLGSAVFVICKDKKGEGNVITDHTNRI